jgi:hypothetical protein
MSLRLQAASVLFPARAELRSRLALWPGIFLPLARARSHTRPLAVGPRTEIVIEGFPRSANSFAVDAFIAAQERPVGVAHHLHAPAQVLEGARRGLPVLLLLRDPLEAVPSLKALRLQGAYRFHQPPMVTSLEHFFRFYARFYERLWPLRSEVEIGHFPVVTRQFDRVIEGLNRRYGARFRPFPHTEAQVRTVQASQGYHAGPSEERARIRASLDAELRGALQSRAASDAQRVYERFAARLP